MIKLEFLKHAAPHKNPLCNGPRHEEEYIFIQF